MHFIGSLGQRISRLFDPLFSFEREFDKVFKNSFASDKDREHFLMKDVKVPTYPIDIFNQTRLLESKEAFRFIPKPESPEKMTAHIMKGFLQSSFSCNAQEWIEGYYVDQHLSSLISLESISKLFQIVKEKAPKLVNEPCVDRAFLYDGAYRNNNEVTDAERFFMNRITGRLAIYFEKQVYEEMGPPDFKSKANLEDITQAVNKGLPLACKHLSYDLSEKDIYFAYMQKLYQERDKRAFKWFEEALAKDLENRALNPRAPLTHLVTIPTFEQEILSKRRKLAAKITLTPILLALSVTLIYLAIKHRGLFRQGVIAIEKFPMRFGLSAQDAKGVITLSKMVGGIIFLNTEWGRHIIASTVVRVARFLTEQID
ncbi:MAG: hypothetical protein QRY71_00960 [Candidatus Rhabdochlamydia sp.]